MGLKIEMKLMEIQDIKRAIGGKNAISEGIRAIGTDH